MHYGPGKRSVLSILIGSHCRQSGSEPPQSNTILSRKDDGVEAQIRSAHWTHTFFQVSWKPYFASHWQRCPASRRVMAIVRSCCSNLSTNHC